MAAAAASICFLRTRQSFSRMRETAFRFPARQTLILEDDRHGHPGAQRSRKRLDARGHVVRRSVEASRKPDHQRRKAILFRRESRELADGAIERIAVEPGRLQHADRPGQGARHVAHRHTDPPLADIQPCHASHVV